MGAEQKAQNAKAAARVAKDAAELKAAEGAIAGFAETHHSAKAIAAKAKADAAAAQALANIKKDVVKLHQDKRDATAKKIEMALVQTGEEFGIIKESLANFGSWLKGKECRMQSCPETCDRKYRLAWGRRLLSADDGLNDADEAETEIQTGSKAQWGGIKKAIKKVIPTKVYYDDCSRKNECLAKNAACKAKLDSLRAAVAALDKEIAAAKDVADAHSATAAQKAKYADLKQKDADAAKALLDEAQSAVAARAKDLADSKKHQDRIKSYQSSEVAKDAKAVAYARREHAEEVKDLKEAQEEMAEANKAVGHATTAHTAQIAEQKAQNAKAAARVAKDAEELKAAQGQIAGFASKHHSAHAVAAKAAADAAAAQALANIKKDVVKLHQEKRDATHKKIEMALVQTEEEFGIIKESLANFGSWLKGKECRMQSCPETCDRKYRLAWG